MNVKRILLWFAIIAVFIWNGQHVESAYATSKKPTQKQASIEHMKVFIRSENPNNFRIEETWYNPDNGNWREEVIGYDLVNNTMNITNHIILENGTREYELKLVNGKLTGQTWINKKPQKPISTANSLFTSIVEQYKSSDWKNLGFVNFEGKQAKHVKKESDQKGDGLGYHWYTAYLDPSTGLPIKTSSTFYENQTSHFFHYFDQLNDSNGEIFNVPSGASIKQVSAP